MIAVLSQPEPGRRSPLFSSREHQDAQELFQLVSECVKKEATAVDREGARDLGFGALASLSSSVTATTSVDVSKGVFDGLTANRRSCCECGYTEAVMHFPFDSWQLNVPRVVRPFPLPCTHPQAE
jgi:ubiquitin carboxyl-terminal hydrolase 1